MKHLIVVAAALAFLSACGKQDATPPAPASSAAPAGPRPEKMPNGEPAVITVEHVLIGFKEAMPKQERSKEEARKLAYEVLNRAKSGEDFTKLRKELSDDNGSPDAGVYTLVNNGVAKQGSEFERSGMVPAFGDVGFALNLNEIGLAEHDQQKSPYGWHIIKRIK
jgi:parvulin-like peptidyl-prolyl isomerase